ncbi:MAG: DUF362 domain-containing protein [Desulfobacteria bacterium]
MNSMVDSCKSKVAIIKCEDYQKEKVYEAVRESVDLLGGIGGFIRDGDRVLLKPNLLSGKTPEKAVTTHPSIVSAVVRLVKEAGGIPCIGDSPGVGGLKMVAEKTGIKEVSDIMGVKLVEFDEAVDVENKRGHIFKRFEVAKAFLEADVIINLPKLKTHGQMLLTLCVKNNFGFVVGNRKAKWHLKAGIDVNFFAQMLLDLYLLIQPRLTIMDGIVGMEGDGPGNGNPRKVGLIFAGIDCVAIDTVICQTLGIPSDDVYTIRAARQKGIGKTDLKEIEVLGEDLEKAKIRDFKLPKTHDIGFRIPKVLSNFIKNTVTSKPSIDHTKCRSCRVCVDLCPSQTMKTVNGKINIGYKTCIRCFCCQELCPEGAVGIKRGWLSNIL